VQAIQQLRSEQGIAETEEIAIYVTNTQVVRSLLKQYSEQIEAQTHTADLVQVNVDGGIPMPTLRLAAKLSRLGLVGRNCLVYA